MFVNYVRKRTRDSPINVAAARMLLGGYLIWKTVWYDWRTVVSTPFRAEEAYYFAVPSEPFLLTLEKWLLIGALLLFIVGYRMRLVTVVSTLLLVHLATVRFTLNISGGTTALFIAAYYLIFFGLYSEADELSVDGFRRTSERSLGFLNRFLKSDNRPDYRMNVLKWNLLLISIIYFGAGFTKLSAAGLGWTDTENLSRIIVIWNHIFAQPVPVGEFLLEYPVLIRISAIGTLALEVGLLVAVLAQLPITLIVLAVFGMHLIIALAVGPFFFDVYLFFLMFFAWDSAFGRLASDREMDLVYDERCYFCARSLYMFKLLDVNGTISFYSQRDVPDRYRDQDGTDFEEAMYVFHGGNAYRGYSAFRELLRQYTAFAPLVWFMDRRVVERTGERVYRYIATNRSRHFTCRIDSSE